MNYTDFFELHPNLFNKASRLFVSHYPYAEWPLDAYNGKILKVITQALDDKEIEDIFSGLRKSGTTTRMIDHFIQELFKNRSIKYYDHHEGDRAVSHMLSKLRYRLAEEHGLKQGVDYKLDKEKRTITLL